MIGGGKLVRIENHPLEGRTEVQIFYSKLSFLNPVKENDGLNSDTPEIRF